MAVEFARRAELPPSITLLTDPSRASYEAAGLKRGLARTLFDPQGFKNFLGAYKKGFRQGATKGDPWQQGGSLVVAQGGQVLYRYVSSTPGDHATPATLLRHLP
jgi:hypothetical protein